MTFIIDSDSLGLAFEELCNDLVNLFFERDDLICFYPRRGTAGNCYRCIGQ